MNPASINWAPLGADRLSDLEQLFGPRGGCAGCWCMLWRGTPAEYRSGKGEGNRLAMHALVKSGRVPGILAYAHNKPIGWCSVAPREHFPGLSRSRVLRPVDTRPVWSISCLLVDKAWRRQGVSVALLRAAAEHARANGAEVIEGYPVTPKTESMPDVFAWTGLASAFTRAGFYEAGRHSPTRPIMRLELRA